MKNIIITALFILLAVPVFASPAAEGNLVVSMPVLSYSKASGERYENFEGTGQNIMILMAGTYEVGVQYFIVQNLAIGGVLNYYKNNWGDSSKTSNSFGPMAAWYFSIDDENMLPYIGIGYLVTETKIEDEFSGNYSSTDTSLMLKGGIAYMLGNNIALYGEIIYVKNSFEDDYGYSDSVDGKVLTFAAGFKSFF